MIRRPLAGSQRFFSPRGFCHALCVVLAAAIVPSCVAAEPTPAAVAAFNAYASSVELRLAQQHRSQSSFLAPVVPEPKSEARLRRGELIVERLNSSSGPSSGPSLGQGLPGAALYHWRGTAFAPGAKAADFERLMKDLSSYPQHFSPQVLEASMLTQQGDHLQAAMRIRQQHVITVVLDTTYDIAFARLDAQHGYSISRSTRIAEVASAGTPAEHALDASQEHGFLWRMNTYWSYEERDGGLYMQIESVSLTRSIPTGLGWAIGPYVESIPRDSLEFTLRATCNALRNKSQIGKSPIGAPGGSKR
jgi:hypothetical protein